jgi:hypothetical protein
MREAQFFNVYHTGRLVLYRTRVGGSVQWDN